MALKLFRLLILLDGLDTVRHTDFMEPDLMVRPMDAYFEHLNFYLPLLHRPTFQQDIQRGLHFRDRSFGTIVLVVCAIGCLWTEESRGRPSQDLLRDGSGLIVGHDQWSLLTWPKRQDLQECAVRTIYTLLEKRCVTNALRLMAAYMTSTHTPQSNWTTPMLTSGIRMVVDAGAHRKKTYTFSINMVYWTTCIAAYLLLTTSACLHM
ncbi:hypothetical protein C8T65DRAFT_741742 [Cerioporus squamosus]|nr:hypothetical protein C8T65DRAFT_741742 [Cerioporus squamosus]